MMIRNLKLIFLNLLKNRISVSMTLICFIFIVIPPLMIISEIPVLSDYTKKNQKLFLIIFITYVLLILIWHITSIFLRKIVGIKEEAGERYYDKNYDDGFEILAMISTFSLYKLIGLKRTKAIFASMAMAMATAMLISIIIGFFSLDLLFFILDNDVYFPFVFILMSIIYYPINYKFLR